MIYQRAQSDCTSANILQLKNFEAAVESQQKKKRDQDSLLGKRKELKEKKDSIKFGGLLGIRIQFISLGLCWHGSFSTKGKMGSCWKIEDWIVLAIRHLLTW